MAGSKTGICSPSERVLTEMQERYGERLLVRREGHCRYSALVFCIPSNKSNVCPSCILAGRNVWLNWCTMQKILNGHCIYLLVSGCSGRPPCTTLLVYLAEAQGDFTIWVVCCSPFLFLHICDQDPRSKEHLSVGRSIPELQTDHYRDLYPGRGFLSLDFKARHYIHCHGVPTLPQILLT